MHLDVELAMILLLIHLVVIVVLWHMYTAAGVNEYASQQRRHRHV